MILTRDIIVQRVAAAAGQRGVRGDRRRSNEDAQIVPYREQDRNEFVRGDRPLKPAAVLVPLIDRPGGLTVMLTRRTDHLSNHGGQISFPGGRRDEGDIDDVATALRETEEEVGLSRDRVSVIGELDDYIVGTGYLVRPVVGIVAPPFDLLAHDREVAEIFEAPLDFIVDPANLLRHSRDVGGVARNHFAIQWRDYYIWGATAGMLRNLSELLWQP